MNTNLPSRKLMAALLGSALLWSVPALAETDDHNVVRNSFGNIVVNNFGNCVRTSWPSAQDVCAAEPPAPVHQRAGLSEEDRTIYFGFNKAALTPDSTQKLNSLADNLKSDDQVKQAQIVGYADRIGTASYNEQLSQRRAEAVRKYLVSRGFVKSQVAQTRWLGESSPVTNCPDNLTRDQLISCLQRDRRVEVEIEYLPQR